MKNADETDICIKGIMRLIDFIKGNEQYEKILAEKSVRVKEDGDLMIFNYLPGADFFDPIVRECRGVILDMDLNVICTGFDKFGNYSEPYAADIDWESAVVQQKLDGSIVKLYWHDGEWNWATNSVIHAENASIQGERYGNFQELIDDADNLPDLEKLDKSYTYIFELVSPYNQIVIHYPRTHLFHIGTRRNDKFRKEVRVNIGVEKPKEYPLHSLEACTMAVKELNNDECEHEGFVVCDKDFNRVKIKTPEYFELHRKKFATMTAELAFGLLQNMRYEDAVKEFPNYDVELAWYLFQFRKFFREKENMEAYAVNLYNEYEQNRKLVANEIKSHPYAHFGFMAINGNPVGEVGWNNVKKYIEEFDYGRKTKG